MTAPRPQRPRGRSRGAGRAGFTLIELLIVMGMLGILSAVTIAAINPGKQLCQTRNATRAVTARELGNAVNQYFIKTGSLPSADAIPLGEGNAKAICRRAITDASCVNLDVLVPEFLIGLPVDGAETNANHAGYAIHKTPPGPVVVASAHGEDCGS